MPLQATSGAASYDAFGGGAAAVPNYIEDVFSTYLYTGNGSTQTITNGIDLAGKGGLVWLKARSDTYSHYLYDTTRPVNYALISNATNGSSLQSDSLTAFNSNGFTLGNRATVNFSGTTFASWTFREQPKFFDVVTYTGTGSVLNVSHNLGSVPGCIIIKRTSAAADWVVYHQSLGNAQALSLNTTQAVAASTAFNSTTPTSTVFTLGSGGAGSAVNASGQTYVAYLFAHDAGGFGLTGTDNVISCGSYTGNSSGVTINLGYEVQFVMVKKTNGDANWSMWDIMRGMPVSADGSGLYPNTSGAEASGGSIRIRPTATGFEIPDASDFVNITGGTYIYIAIRRGPMKVPTSGTSVFSPNASSAATGTAITTSFPVDLQIGKYRDGASGITAVDRLRGVSTTSTELAYGLVTSSTAAEDTSNTRSLAWDNTGFQMPSWLGSISDIFWNFRRAPSFFDEVCETSTSATNKPVTHNLAAVPELIIVKKRSASGTNWVVYASAVTTLSQYLVLNTTAARATSSNIWGLSSPTTTTFNINENSVVGSTGSTYVAYLFASCPGVSKVGSYTGTGTTKQVDCGFTGGARFVLIKRTDSTGDWYVWDSARGIVSGNDPYLLLNSTAAEVTTTDYIDTYSAGFEISSTAPAAINASGGTFIFLAIA